jgi:ferredoxin-NADP reductase
MHPNVSTIVAAAVFLALAFTNVVLMLEASNPSRNAATKSRLIVVHRVGGYLFVALFCIMAYIMSRRLAGAGITNHLPTYLVLHIVLALSLGPLVLLKLVIARFYKQSFSSLRALGMAIFVISFVLVSIPTFSELLRSTSPGSFGLKVATILLVAACLVQCLLILRSRRKQSQAVLEAMPLPEHPAPVIAPGNNQSTEGPRTLLLTHFEQQTHDTKTLRFLVPEARHLCFKPGQFLTFRWTVNGERVPRSYTISSSPTHSNYVEITPKRMEKGCVSVFLNDQAKAGLTVEATGPYGQFYFDETIHPSIVLLAAGSGITPMMCMLRYIDDLKLSTSATLLYFVRTRNDIIFASELERLSKSLGNFKYGVCLSRPDEGWTGHAGHLTAQLISQHVPELLSQTFFLCGPKGFMDNARQILAALGVSQDRIAQESFGEQGKSVDLPRSDAAATIVFSQSQKVCQAGAECILLEVAEKNGVQIPYGCRQGVCGTCATRMLSGAVDMDSEAGLNPGQKDAGYVLPCVSRAKGTVVLVA